MLNLASDEVLVNFGHPIRDPFNKLINYFNFLIYNNGITFPLEGCYRALPIVSPPLHPVYTPS